MKIKIDEESYFATVDTTWLAMQGECITRSVFVEYPIVKGTTDYFLRVEMPDMTVYDLQIVNNQVVLTNTITAYAATIPLQWIAKDNTGAIIAKSQIIHAVVKDSIDGDASALPTPEEMKNYYDTYISTITETGDQYLSEMETIQQNVNQTSETVKADADRTESNVNRAESLLQSMQGTTIGERARLYVDTVSGSDSNDGRTTTTAVKTLDRVLVLANTYKNAIICLKRGQTYTATDQTNEYGSGIHLYTRSIRLEAIQNNDSILPAPKVQNAIFCYHGFLEIEDIDFASSNSGITLYNSFCNLNKTTMQYIKPYNSVMMLSNCTTPYLLQYGGCTAIYGGQINSIQVENGGFLNFTNCSVTGYVSAPPSIICQNGVPVYMAQAKRIAEESTETITRYVDASSGSNSSPGTQSAPYRTLDAALHDVMYAKKAIIYLAAGTYSIPNKTVTWIHQDIRIYGNTKEDTIIQGNIVAENSFLRLARVTVDSTDSETANVSANTITAQYGTILRMDSCIVNTAYNMCVNCTETSKSYLTNCTFSGALQYAVHTTGFGDVRIYQCSDNSEKGVRSGGGSVVYITNSSSSTEFPYINGNYGIVYVNGQQVLPQTAETAAILSMGGNV
ncbi:MAG: DUF1565 domain-containing protein [Ruminococcus sp.]